MTEKGATKPEPPTPIKGGSWEAKHREEEKKNLMRSIVGIAFLATMVVATIATVVLDPNNLEYLFLVPALFFSLVFLVCPDVVS